MHDAADRLPQLAITTGRGDNNTGTCLNRVPQSPMAQGSVVNHWHRSHQPRETLAQPVSVPRWHAPLPPPPVTQNAPPSRVTDHC
ncbi:unnamed protein product [Arctogadus glacialis]